MYSKVTTDYKRDTKELYFWLLNETNREEGGGEEGEVYGPTFSLHFPGPAAGMDLSPKTDCSSLCQR
jgi:hypothetical protein